MSACNSCSARIFWAETESGKTIPIDWDRVPGGNIELSRRLQELPLAVYVAPSPGVARFQSHFASCPHARQWRKEGKSA